MNSCIKVLVLTVLLSSACVNKQDEANAVQVNKALLENSTKNLTQDEIHELAVKLMLLPGMTAEKLMKLGTEYDARVEAQDKANEVQVNKVIHPYGMGINGLTQREVGELVVKFMVLPGMTAEKLGVIFAKNDDRLNEAEAQGVEQNRRAAVLKSKLEAPFVAAGCALVGCP